VVEAIGPVQAQNWAAPPLAIWARTGRAVDLAPALEQRQLIYGFLLRGTLHLVSTRDYPSYAAVVEASGVIASASGLDNLRRDLLGFAATPRAGTELVEFIEDWVGRRRPALEASELARQRSYRWRPLLRWTALVRAPEGGRWRKAPRAQVAAPIAPDRWPAPEAALKDVVTRHLRAFGPAGPDDVAQWIGWKTPRVRAAMEGMDLDRLEDERGRKLYDVPGAPRPDPEVPAPPRLLPWFDNAILAYSPSQRARIMPVEYKDRVYQRANLQWLPTILVDGMVAGTWAPRSSLNLFTKFPRPVVAELEALLAQCPA
jgi:hypothetical protein